MMLRFRRRSCQFKLPVFVRASVVVRSPHESSWTGSRVAEAAGAFALQRGGAAQRGTKKTIVTPRYHAVFEQVSGSLLLLIA